MEGKRQLRPVATVAVLLSNLCTNHALSQPQLRPPPSTNNRPSPIFPPAQRLKVTEFRRQYPTGSLDDRPIIITGAMSVDECENLCDQWIQAVGEEPITIQRKRPDTTQLYDCTVAHSLDLMMQSTPNDSIFAFVEGLLDNKNGINVELSSISKTLTHARESLFEKDPNWFDYFPSSAQPTDCVVIAGEGATSTLHRDPFEWTGTSLCLEGRKIWRFLAEPASVWDRQLQCYRLNSTAWNANNYDGKEEKEDEEVILSAGWQSDVSLYQRQQQKEGLLSARELAEMPNEEAEAYLEELASTTNQLAPPKKLWNEMKGCSVVQHPGELLLIPPYWYHQTYAPEPSLAVAAQRCGSKLDAVRVLRHILSLQQQPQESINNNPPQPIQSLLNGDSQPTSANPQAMVNLLFDHLGNQHK